MQRKMAGFTIVELMVLFVIIGILATVAIPKFVKANIKSKMYSVMSM